MKIFSSKHTVRTYECDFYGHVNNAIYLNYLEFGRMEALWQEGFTLETMKKSGYFVVVRRIEIDYKHPLHMGDEIEIRTFASESRKTSGAFTQQIMRLDENILAAEARVVWVFTNLKGKPIPVPSPIRNAFNI